MHLLFLFPTGFLSVAKTTGKKSCTWFNGANPQSRSQHGKWSVFHSAPKAIRHFWCEKDSWFFFFFITHFFPRMSFFGPFQWMESVSSLRGYGLWLHRKDAATLWK
jgi:hypothetical protein